MRESGAERPGTGAVGAGDRRERRRASPRRGRARRPRGSDGARRGRRRAGRRRGVRQRGAARVPARRDRAADRRGARLRPRDGGDRHRHGAGHRPAARLGGARPRAAADDDARQARDDRRRRRRPRDRGADALRARRGLGGRRLGAAAAELREVLDPLPGAPLGVVVLHGVDELAHEARRQVDAADDDAGDLLVLHLVIHAGERDRELVVGVADVREVRVDAGHDLRREVDVDVALGPVLVGSHGPSVPGDEAGRRVRGAAAPALRRRRPALLAAAGPARPPGARRGARGRGRRAPHPRARLRLAAGQRRRDLRLRVVLALARGAPDGRARRLLRHRRADGTRPAVRPPPLVRPAHAAAPAGAGRAARAALPRPQDPRQRAVPSLAVPTPLDELRDTVNEAAAALANGGPRSEPTLERPKRADFGDYSTNAAMLLAPVLKASPRDVAARLGDELRGRLADRLERVEIAGPGFLNLWLGDDWFRDAARAIIAAGDAYGGATAAVREKVDVEFVSANPTGPMHVGHAPNPAYGDALARQPGVAGP